jgi:hypothetical protein
MRRAYRLVARSLLPEKKAEEALPSVAGLRAWMAAMGALTAAVAYAVYLVVHLLNW